MEKEHLKPRSRLDELHRKLQSETSDAGRYLKGVSPGERVKIGRETGEMRDRTNKLMEKIDPYYKRKAYEARRERFQGRFADVRETPDTVRKEREKVGITIQQRLALVGSKREVKHIGMVDFKLDNLRQEEIGGLRTKEDWIKTQPKVTYEEMHRGFDSLKRMEPYINKGYGNDKLRNLKDASGKPMFTQTDLNIYDVYHGPRRIKVTKIGNYYDVGGGRHRLWAARDSGVKSLPVDLTEIKQKR